LKASGNLFDVLLPFLARHFGREPECHNSSDHGNFLPLMSIAARCAILRGHGVLHCVCLLLTQSGHCVALRSDCRAVGCPVLSVRAEDETGEFIAFFGSAAVAAHCSCRACHKTSAHRLDYSRFAPGRIHWRNLMGQLEPTTQAFIDCLAGATPIYTLSPEAARNVLAGAQKSVSVTLAPARSEDRTLNVGPKGRTDIRVYRPEKAKATLPVVIYTHGGGWVLGDRETHDRLVRELTV